MLEFKDKVVIITGASSGIGADTAVEFASAGASVALVARSTEGLQKTAEKCKEAGAIDQQVLCVSADLTDEAQGKHAVEETMKKFNKINILVNNAGEFKLGGLADTTVADVENMFKVNTMSAYIMSQACLPHLLESKGNIVNMSSIAGTHPFPRSLTYGMAKAAVVQLTKCTAIELAPKGVRVNCVCPGSIMTDLFTRPGSFVKDPADLDQFLKSTASAHPMGRIGETNEVADAILFLASDAASFITGCCMPIDGGSHATVAYPKDI